MTSLRRKLVSAIFLLMQFALGFSGASPVHSDDSHSYVLSVDEVKRTLGDSAWILIDTRPTDAYNGWKLDGVSRGGHLPGAVDFPASWLDHESANKEQVLKAALRAKGITSAKKVVLYGTKLQDQQRVAEYLRAAGHSELYFFSLEPWANDLSLPLVRYDAFQLLVPPSDVKHLLDGEYPETFQPGKPIKFVEASWGTENASYLNGHVPKSFHVNTDDFEPPPKWMLGDSKVLERFARKYGFHAEDTVIVSSADPTASFRLAIVLRYMGVRDVRVLNGGFAAWTAAGYPAETTSTQPTVRPTASAGFGAKIPARPTLIDSLVETRDKLLQSDSFTLIDTRTWAEFTGETSGYKYHTEKGRIPGSIFGQADYRGKQSLSPYRNIDNTMRNAREIRELWRDSGIDTTRHLCFMCGGGWRAAEILTFAQVMGLSDTSLFSDGWIGWSDTPEYPTESGRVKDAQKPDR